MDGKCVISIGPGKKAVSTCSAVYNFAISSAAKKSKAKPSTNVPMRCAFCTETHWKYNMMQHLRDRHPSWKNDINGARFAQEIEISEERSGLGIPSDTSIAEREIMMSITSGLKVFSRAIELNHGNGSFFLLHWETSRYQTSDYQQCSD